jgi:hypothetical protein
MHILTDYQRACRRRRCSGVHSVLTMNGYCPQCGMQTSQKLLYMLLVVVEH